MGDTLQRQLQYGWQHVGVVGHVCRQQRQLHARAHRVTCRARTVPTAVATGLQCVAQSALGRTGLDAPVQRLRDGLLFAGHQCERLQGLCSARNQCVLFRRRVRLVEVQHGLLSQQPQWGRRRVRALQGQR